MDWDSRNGGFITGFSRGNFGGLCRYKLPLRIKMMRPGEAIDYGILSISYQIKIMYINIYKINESYC